MWMWTSCPYGLVAEQLSGTSFTTPRLKNQRSWLYRIRPSVTHEPFAPTDAGLYKTDFTRELIDPNQMRWAPFPMPADDEAKDFISGMSTICGAGSPELKNGMGIHVYACNRSMVDRAFCNSDGDMLVRHSLPRPRSFRFPT
jgi:homogentisate 1,2-dioxygenase